MRTCQSNKLNFPKYLFGNSGDKFIAKLEVFSKLIEDGRNVKDVMFQNPRAYQNRDYLDGFYKACADTCLPENSITVTESAMCAVQLHIFTCRDNAPQDSVFTPKLCSLINGASAYCTIFQQKSHSTGL